MSGRTGSGKNPFITTEEREMNNQNFRRNREQNWQNQRYNNFVRFKDQRNQRQYSETKGTTRKRTGRSGTRVNAHRYFNYHQNRKNERQSTEGMQSKPENELNNVIEDAQNTIQYQAFTQTYDNLYEKITSTSTKNDNTFEINLKNMKKENVNDNKITKKDDVSTKITENPSKKSVTNKTTSSSSSSDSSTSSDSEDSLIRNLKNNIENGVQNKSPLKIQIKVEPEQKSKSNETPIIIQAQNSNSNVNSTKGESNSKTDNSNKNPKSFEKNKTKTRKSISSSSSSSSSLSDSSSDSDSSNNKKADEKHNQQEKVDKKRKTVSEEEVVCLGPVENFENLVEDDEKCLLCDKKDHTSFFCQTICRNCGEKYHNFKMCTKPANISLVLQQFFEFCMKQCSNYNPNEHFEFQMNESKTMRDFTQSSSLCSWIHNTSRKNVTDSNSDNASSASRSKRKRKHSKKSKNSNEVKQNLYSTQPIQFVPINYSAPNVKITYSTDSESSLEQENNTKKRKRSKKKKDIDTTLYATHPQIPFVPSIPYGFNTPNLSFNPMIAFKQMMGINPAINFTGSSEKGKKSD